MSAVVLLGDLAPRVWRGRLPKRPAPGEGKGDEWESDGHRHGCGRTRVHFAHCCGALECDCGGCYCDPFTPKRDGW